MEWDSKKAELAVLAAGFLIAAGILEIALAASSDMPSGYAVLSGDTSCCEDCSCIGLDLCRSCGGCGWVSGCKAMENGMNPEGVELVHSASVRDGSSFTLNAVLRPERSGQVLVQLNLPNGFSADRNPVKADLKAGETRVVPFEVAVRENVAEKEHIIVAEVIGADWKTTSRASAAVRVWWAH
jgi:hypothetical protein